MFAAYLHFCVAMAHIDGYVEFLAPVLQAFEHVTVECSERRDVDDLYALCCSALFCSTSLEKIGSRTASVLPVPVGAIKSTFSPPKLAGRLWFGAEWAL